MEDGHNGSIYSVSWSPDSEQALAAVRGLTDAHGNQSSTDINDLSRRVNEIMRGYDREDNAARRAKKKRRAMRRWTSTGLNGWFSIVRSYITQTETAKRGKEQRYCYPLRQRPRQQPRHMAQRRRASQPIQQRMKGSSFDPSTEPQVSKRKRSSSVEIEWRPLRWPCRQRKILLGFRVRTIEFKIRLQAMEQQAQLKDEPQVSKRMKSSSMEIEWRPLRWLIW